MPISAAGGYSAGGGRAGSLRWRTGCASACSLCTDAPWRDGSGRKRSVSHRIKNRHARARRCWWIRGRCDVTVCIYHGGFEEDPATGGSFDDSGENVSLRALLEPGPTCSRASASEGSRAARCGRLPCAVAGLLPRCYAEVTGTVGGMAGRFGLRQPERGDGCGGGSSHASSGRLPRLIQPPPAPGNWESRRGSVRCPGPSDSHTGPGAHGFHGSALADFINRCRWRSLARRFPLSAFHHDNLACSPRWCAWRMWPRLHQRKYPVRGV